MRLRGAFSNGGSSGHQSFPRKGKGERGKGKGGFWEIGVVGIAVPVYGVGNADFGFSNGGRSRHCFFPKRGKGEFGGLGSVIIAVPVYEAGNADFDGGVGFEADILHQVIDIGVGDGDIARLHG